ncbi:MAG TPA: hypothetical protein PLD46_00405 [Hyphomicrobium sp.]|nr:hypothetical protein [Hyphomicrobium sp.]
MRLAVYTQHLISLGQTIYLWAGHLSEMDRARRDKVALYAEEIAATLSRAASALAALEIAPDDQPALLAATRELGRISGYVETIMSALQRHLDGRKRAGVKRRLEHLQPFELEAALAENGAFRQARRLTAAEGYFRALADALRA